MSVDFSSTLKNYARTNRCEVCHDNLTGYHIISGFPCDKKIDDNVIIHRLTVYSEFYADWVDSFHAYHERCYETYKKRPQETLEEIRCPKCVAVFKRDVSKTIRIFSQSELCNLEDLG